MAGRAWTGLLLGLMVGLAAPARSQVPTSPPVFELGDNFPNPFFPATSIPFVLTPEACTDGHIPLVTLEIYNVLVQVVAVPELQTGGRERVRGLRGADPMWPTGAAATWMTSERSRRGCITTV